MIGENDETRAGADGGDGGVGGDGGLPVSVLWANREKRAVAKCGSTRLDRSVQLVSTLMLTAHTHTHSNTSLVLSSSKFESVKAIRWSRRRQQCGRA